MIIPDRGALPTAVVGLALLDNQLYAVCKKSFNVLVYDTKDKSQVRVTSCGTAAAAAAAAAVLLLLYYCFTYCLIDQQTREDIPA